jgi:hypothetical protein
MHWVKYCGLVLLLVSSRASVGAEESPGKEVSEPVQKRHYSLFDPAPGPSVRDINALYENPYTVDAGHFQLETFMLQYARDRSHFQGSTTLRETWSFGPMTLKLGLLNQLDAEVVLSPYTHARYENMTTGTSTSVSGFGSVTPRVKLNLWGNDGGKNALAIVPFLKIPTHSRGLGNGAVEGGIILPFAQQLPRGWWMVLSPEADCARDVFSDGYHLNLGNTIYFCHQLAGKLSGYADFLSSVSMEKRASWIGIFDFGFSYALKRNAQIDLGLSIGVSAAADDLNPYLGYSFRF